MENAKRVELLDGEELCPKCNGFPKTRNGIIETTCLHCKGHGKVDWVDHIMGNSRPKNKLRATWTIEVEEDLKLCYGINDDAVEELTNILSSEIINGS